MADCADFSEPHSSDSADARPPTDASANTLHSEDAARRCGACGYDVRGIGSRVCPECGEAILWQRLVTPQSPGHERAIDVLRAAGVETRFSDPSIGAMHVSFGAGGSSNFSNIVWIPAYRANDAIDALDQAGILIPIPIIDIDDARCPTCASWVTAQDAHSCGTCGSVIEWVDVDADLRPGHRRTRASGLNTAAAPAQFEAASKHQRRAFLGAVMIFAAITIAIISLQLAARYSNWIAVPPSVASLLLGIAGCRLAGLRHSRSAR